MRKINILLMFFLISIFRYGFCEEVILNDKPIEINVTGIDDDDLKELCCHKELSASDVEAIIENSKFCEVDSDCKRLSKGRIQGPFGCRSFAINKNNEEQVLSAIECHHRGPCITKTSCGMNISYHRGSYHLRRGCEVNVAPVFCKKGKCEFKYESFQKFVERYKVFAPNGRFNKK